MEKADERETPNSGADQAPRLTESESRVACVEAAGKLFSQIEEVHGAEFARFVFGFVSGANNKRHIQAIHAMRLRFHVEWEMRAGRTKQEIIDLLAFDHTTEVGRRMQRRTLSWLGLNGIDPASLRRRIDRLLSDKELSDIFGR